MQTPRFIVLIQKSICASFVLLWVLSALVALFMMGQDWPVVAAISVACFALGSRKWSPFSASKRDLLAWFLLTLFTINPLPAFSYVPIPVTWLWAVIESRPAERVTSAIVGAISGTFMLLLFLPSLRFLVVDKRSEQ